MVPGPVNPPNFLKRNNIDVIFPFYHAASDEKLNHLTHLYHLPTVDEFKRDLEYLLRYFTPVKMSDLIFGQVRPRAGRPLMVLSFDDGLAECYNQVVPLLLSKGVPAAFFLNNAFIDNKSMFFRFKANLLADLTDGAGEAARNRASEVLHCRNTEIKKRLLRVSYAEREMTDQVAKIYGFSFVEYLRKKPVYLSSIQIIKMLEDGFEIGSHGIDHPLFSLLKREVVVDHIRSSVEGIRDKFKLDYNFFAFPFTDSGVEDSTIDELFKKRIIDAGFGTAGLKDDPWPAYYQRIPMEQLHMDARSTLRGEFNRRRFRKIAGRNATRR